MAFEQPELAAALRELAIERDPAMAASRQTYVDYAADGSIERINWPQKLGALPEPANLEARMATIRDRLAQRPARQPPDLTMPGPPPPKGPRP